MSRKHLLALCVGVSLFRAEAATWWQEHPDPASWIAERENLKSYLQKDLSKKNPSDLKLDSIDADNFRIWQWLDYARPDFSFDEVAAFRSLGEHSQVRRAFLENLRPEDDATEAMRILLQIQLAHPECIQELPCLAVAIALVFDQPFLSCFGRVRMHARLVTSFVYVAFRLYRLAVQNTKQFSERRNESAFSVVGYKISRRR
jgi:hypothetical protein